MQVLTVARGRVLPHKATNAPPACDSAVMMWRHNVIAATVKLAFDKLEPST